MTKKKTKPSSHKNRHNMLLVLAAYLALSVLKKKLKTCYRQDGLLRHTAAHLRRTIDFVRGYFAAQGVQFNEQGDPCLPAVPLDTKNAGKVELLALSYAEAQRVVSAALNVDPGEQDFDLNKVSQAFIVLEAQALKLGAYPELQTEDPTTGEKIPAVVRTFLCDVQTGQPLGRPVGWPCDDES